jgi:hypothetical protein
MKFCNNGSLIFQIIPDKRASGDGKSEKTQNAEEIKANVHYFEENKKIKISRL